MTNTPTLVFPDKGRRIIFVVTNRTTHAHIVEIREKVLPYGQRNIDLLDRFLLQKQ